LLTLYTTPVIYLAMERLKMRLQRLTRPPPPHAAAPVAPPTYPPQAAE